MSLNGARMRYVDENGEVVLVPAKGRTFQIGSYFSCDVILEPQAERLICEITCDAFGRVTLLNQSNKETAIYLNDKLIHGQRSHPLLHGSRITILDRVYTWESHKMSGSEDVASTPERLPPVEQAPNSCPSLKSHRPQIDKRLTVHNFHYSINSDEEGNTSIESRDRSESHLEDQESLNYSTPLSTELSSCETPKVDLVEATQNKENTATPTASHQQLLQLCALSDVVITSYSPRETGVKVEKSFTCVRKPTKICKQAAAATAASVTMSTPKSVYSTPKGGVLSELNDDSCSRDLLDFGTPSTSKKTKRESSMYLIDLTTPSKLRPSFKPTPISVDSTDESSDGSPLVIDITKSATPPTPGRSHLAMTPRRPADAVAATPTRTPQSLMKRALLTSTKKNQIAANQINKTPVATPSRTSPRPRTLPRMPFVTLPTPEQKEARHAAFFAKKNQTPKSIPHKRQSLHLGTPRDNKLSQARKSLAAAKRSPTVDLRTKLKAKARRTLNSPKSNSPQSAASPTTKTTWNVSHAKCSTPEKGDDSTTDDLSRTFTIMNESGDPAEEASEPGIISALSVAYKNSPTPAEIREDPCVEDQASGNPGIELPPAVDKVNSPNKDDAEICENGTRSFVASCQEPGYVGKESTVQAIEKEDNIIEDSICEEVHANIPQQLADDDKLSKVTDSCEEESPDTKSSDSFAEGEENKEPTSRIETPMIRRSLRRLSEETKAEGSKKGTRRASCSALADTQEVSGTPRRKRRLSEQMCTPTRQSKCLMVNTPKATLQVDDSIGDMGVIVEEDDDEKPSVVEDENYGKELPCDEPDNVDYHGLRDLLKTPKNCSTPRFKGLREMMRTPKVPASPIFGNIEELLDNSLSDGSTPPQNQSGRSITVARVAVDSSKALERVLKTPSARNIMVPNEPPSAVLKSRGDSLATTTEYDLDMTDTTLHLDQIFDDVPSTSDVNVTSVSTASGLDPRKEETPMSVCKLEATGVASHKSEPLTSTTYKTAMQVDLELSTFTEEGEEASRPSSLSSNEMSGMQLLDQTSDSIYSEPLIVSGVESCNVTVDETRALGQTTAYQPPEINDVDTDSNVGLTEPLVLSDDDDAEAEAEAEVVEDSRVTSQKSIASKEVSIAYRLEESIVSRDITLNQSKSKRSVGETSGKGTTISRGNDSLIEEVSLIEVNESMADESINKDEKSLIIELDSASDTDAEPTKDESGAVELTIVESEVFPLDSSQKDEVSTSFDKKPVESRYANAELGFEVPTQSSEPQVIDPLASEEVLVKTNEARTKEEKGNYVAEDTETLPSDATANSSIIVNEKLSTTNSESTTTEEYLTCEAAEYQSMSHKLATKRLAVSTETDAPDSTADNDIVLEEEISTNIDQNPTTSEEDQSVTNTLAPKELADEKITGDDGKENDVAAEVLPFDLTAANSVVKVEFLANVDQKPIDSDMTITINELDPANPAKEYLSLIDALPSEEQAEDMITKDDTKETAAAVDSDISPLDSTADSLAIHINPQAEPLTNDDQKPTDSKSSITNEVLPGKSAESAIEESSVEAITDKMAVESLGQDAENNKIEGISIVTKPEGGEASFLKKPRSDAEPRTSEAPLVKAATNDDTADTAEKPKAVPEQTTLELPIVDGIEIRKGDTEDMPIAPTDGVASETSTPYIHEVEVVLPTDESTPEASVIPNPSPANIQVDETAEQDAAEVHKNSLIPQERNVSAISDLALTEKKNTNVGKDNSTSLETKQNKSCAQEPVSPKVGPPTVDMAVEENSLNTSSIIMESFTEQPKPDSTEQKQLYSTKNASIQSESEEFKAIEDSSGRLIRPNEVEETSMDTSKVIDTVKESLKEQICQIIPSASAKVSDNPESVNEDYATEQPGEDDEPIADKLESSAKSEDSSLSECLKMRLSENAELFITEAPKNTIAGDGAQEASATEEPLIAMINEDASVMSEAKTVCDYESSRDSESAKDEPQHSESTPTDAASEGKSRDRTATEEAVQDIPLASPKANSLSLIEEAAVKNPSATENEVMSEELAEGTSDEHHINAKSLNQETIQAAEDNEVYDVIDLSDDSESNPVKEGHGPAPMPTSEVAVSLAVEEPPTTEDPREIKLEDVPEEVTTIAEDHKTAKEITDIIDLSYDSDSNPVEEDHNPGLVPASEEDASVPIEETLPTEDSKKSNVKNVPEEITPIAENLNTLNEPVSEANTSASYIETIANQEPNDGQVEDVSDELQNGARTETIAESVTNFKQDEKSQHKSNIEGSADEESPSKEKDGQVSSSVEIDFKHVRNVEASKEKDSNSENIQNDKLATRITSSSEPETFEKFKETSPEPSVSIKHSTMKAVHSARKPSRHEDEPSAKEELKPGKRATRKGSASVETPAEEALAKPSRLTRKPSAEVEEPKSTDIHEKPKRRVIRKASAEVEPMTHIQDKKQETNEEDVLKVIPEEAHSSRAKDENESQKETESDQKQEEDVLEKPKRRGRKPSAEVKSADITEKPKRRGRKPSAEVPDPDPMVHIEKQKEIEEQPDEEEQAHSSKINKQHEPQEKAESSQKKEVEGEEEHIKNKEEIAEEPNEPNELQEEDEGKELAKFKETKSAITKSRTERPKRRGRKASAEETETALNKKPKTDDILDVTEETDTPTFTQMKEQETQKPEKSKRRGRKASAEEGANNEVKLPTAEEVPKSIGEDYNELKATSTSTEKPEEALTEGRSRRRGRRPSIELLEGTAASQPKSANGNAERPLAAVLEDQPPNLPELKGPQKRTRKSSDLVPAEVSESAKEADHMERPKRRGRKPSVDIEHVVQDVPDKPRRRGRTPAEHPEKQSSGEAKEGEPDKKSRRTARKLSAETIEAVVPHIEEHLKDIEEVAEAELESEAATTALPEEEPKTRRRGRKLQLETLEMPSKNTAEVGHSRLRGRKATEDEAVKSEEPIEGDTNVEGEQHNIDPPDSNNEVLEVPSDVVEAEVTTAAGIKTKRRVRKAPKANTRHGRKEDTQVDDDNGREKKIELLQVPTESVPAVVIMSSQIADGAVGSEVDTTPRRREGRNLPRKNYDESTDEEKQRSSRRPRKPAPSKVLAFKAQEEASTPLTKPQPVEEVETPANAVPTEEPTSTQRREGRNVPRKNYTEAPDDDKPSTSRNRRVRHLTAKALELIVDSSPRPNTPRGRKVKAAAKDELPAKRASLEAAPPTQAESGAEEEPAPVIAKRRAAARRKADGDLSEPGTAPSSKRGKGQHEDSEEQPEAKPVARNARGTARKAKAVSDPNEAIPAKKARGGSRAKSPVKPPEDKSVAEPEEHSAPSKKGRGGTRAKTPVAVIPEDTATKPEGEPAKKPSARSRARGGTKAVAVPEPEPDVEPIPSGTSTSRGGRAKKVHFEATETATASAEDAPKRATRSRRK